MIYLAVAHLLGIPVFAFLFWRRTKEDYISSQIFSTIFVILILLLPAFIFPKYWFWLGFLGAISGVAVSKYRNRFVFYETVEVLVVSLLPWVALIFLVDSIINSSLISLLVVVFISLLLALYNFLNSRYKRFGWYRSGKVGFAGLTILGVLFLVRGVVAIFFPSVLSFVGGFEALLSGVASLLVFLGVFDLSRKI